MSFAGVMIDELSQSVERAFARASYSPKIPPNDERPMAEGHGGDVPQKMCAYGASGNSKPAATAVARTEYLHSGPIVNVQHSKDGDKITNEWIEEPRLEVITPEKDFPVLLDARRRRMA